MGRVVVEAVVENYGDVERAERGEIGVDGVRRLRVNALVDSGATYLCLPKSMVEQLGLRFQRAKETRTAAGIMTLGVYGAAKVAIEGRECITEIMELPEGQTPLLGQVPLELMDWWIDLASHCLVGNPEHGGHWMAEAF
ncbi:MAG: retroviral-like aspartic protease family protein [Planctomycetota bacterium]